MLLEGIGKSLHSEEYKMKNPWPKYTKELLEALKESHPCSPTAAMPCTFNSPALSAWTLAALILCARGAPLDHAPTDVPAGDPSGGGEEEEEREAVRPPGLLSESKNLKLILDATDLHKEEFKTEFPNVMLYHLLENYKITSLPASCPTSNFSMENCLHRLVHGMLVYTVLLRHVEREYPSSPVLSLVKVSIDPLIHQAKEKMRKPGAVTVLSGSQEQQLLQEVNHPDAFTRKMIAHNILRKLHDFLRTAQLSIRKKEMSKIHASRKTAPSS